jgi:hypothetical protein
MPFEKGSFPCCCVANRNNFNENCCGLCGPPTGDPKIFEMLPLQPKDAETFVKEAKKQLVGRSTCMPASSALAYITALPHKPVLTAPTAHLHDVRRARYAGDGSRKGGPRRRRGRPRGVRHSRIHIREKTCDGGRGGPDNRSGEGRWEWCRVGELFGAWRGQPTWPCEPSTGSEGEG